MGSVPGGGMFLKVTHGVDGRCLYEEGALKGLSTEQAIRAEAEERSLCTGALLRAALTPQITSIKLTFPPTRR